MVWLIMAVIILDTESRVTPTAVSTGEWLLLVLAIWRAGRLVSSDITTRWFREQFYDLKKVGKGMVLEKPKSGPRRAILDIITSPWSLSLWLGSLLTFCFLLSEYFFYPLIFLALSGGVGFLEALLGFLQKNSARDDWAD